MKQIPLNAGHRGFDKEIETFAELLATHYCESPNENEEAIERYIQSVQCQLYHNVNKFSHRFAMGYQALIEEISKQESSIDK